jgi:hypothetical protein
MSQRANILQELKELESKLPGSLPQPVYSVPEGYFEGLASLMLSRVKAMEAGSVKEELTYLSPLLAGTLSRIMPYALPEGYFESLEEGLLYAIKNENDPREELATLSPLLSGLKKEMPFTVPAGYFDRLSAEPAKPAAKVVSFSSLKWFRYAAAAVVTGVIVLAGFLALNDKTKDPAKSLVKFEKKLNKEIKKMSDKELDDFMQFSEAGLNGEEKVGINPSDDIKDLLKDVPDTELKEFLEETSDTEAGPETSIMN